MPKPHLIKFAVAFSIVFLLVFFGSPSSAAFGQTADATLIIPGKSSGEDNSAITDYMASEVRNKGGRMFIIVRLGQGKTLGLVITGYER